MKAFYSDRGYQIFYEIMNQLQNVIYIGVLFYYIYLAKHKRQEWEYFLGLVLIGEVLFSLLWEAKSRYVFPYIVIALPAAAMGYWYLCNCIGKYLKPRTLISAYAVWYFPESDGDSDETYGANNSASKRWILCDP